MLGGACTLGRLAASKRGLCGSACTCGGLDLQTHAFIFVFLLKNRTSVNGIYRYTHASRRAYARPDV